LRIFKELYGAGILFFYYTKYVILIGYPLLVYGLEYTRSLPIDLLWLYCLGLMIKDFVYTVLLKKHYCPQKRS